MGKPKVSPARQLERLYEQVPSVPCRGACADTCTSFPAPRVEKRRLFKVTGVDLGSTQPDPRKTVCPLLTDLGQCSVYAIRPLICRLWGVSELFPCNYGCKPDGGSLLSVKESYRLLAEAYEISGQPGPAADLRRVLAVSDDEVAAVAPLMKAVAWGRISQQEGARRVQRRRGGAES